MRPADDMTCKDLVDLVTDYVEGALSPADHRRFEAHCEGCEIYLDQMRETIQLLGELPHETVPPEARCKLLNAFRAWKKDA